MPTTLQDIAKHLDLSLPTVSQILNPQSKRAAFFSESTRNRFRQAGH
ncbi:MAG: LacI family DNA-binding transcriptional regulator [Blastochloris sp.]|nr:LacI family DNA-binding transcriptional regulator [Blastochloris sp.]